MCGIAGIIDFAGRPIDPALLERLCTALAHRGPDDQGVWHTRREGFSAGLAHTRLAIIDPTPEGRQPMLDAGGRYALAYNGELYNFHALRDELGGPWRTTCDTEVVLEACIRMGPAALQRLNAMWAMAFVDAQARSGHISRDPFGIKPLYYTLQNDRLAFASELPALTCIPDLDWEIDRTALAVYLQLGFIPQPLTIYRHFRKLAPGHIIRFDASGVHEPERYHRLRGPAGPPPAYGDACRELRERITSAVNRQCISDVPLGAFLSGGLDSSIIVAAMARADGPPVRTFTIGYGDHARYDESAHAETVARHLGTEHRTFRLGFGDVLAAVDPALDHLGEPFADSSLLPTWLVSRSTRQHVTVALSGDGGDELFGGYWRYFGHAYLQRYRRIPRALRKSVIEPLARLAPAGRTTRALDRLRQVRKLMRGDLADAMDTHLAWARILEPGLASALTGAADAEAAAAHIAAVYRAAPADLSPRHADSPTTLEHILLADLAITLPADMLFKVDTASMHHNLEVRVPFLATAVVEFVTALPLEYRIQGATGKRILRDAFADLLPRSILHRPKMGFEVPIGEFLRNELLATFRETVTPQALGSLGIHAGTAEQLLDQHLHRRDDRTEILWALFVLCRWHERSGSHLRA